MLWETPPLKVLLPWMTVWPAALVPESVEFPACVFDCVEIVEVRFGVIHRLDARHRDVVDLRIEPLHLDVEIAFEGEPHRIIEAQPDDRTRVARVRPPSFASSGV